MTVAAASTLAETRFSVPGIHCAGCIAKLERELPGHAGIAAARVNFAHKRVTLWHAAAADTHALEEAIAALGFEAQPLAPGVDAGRAAASEDLMRCLAVAAFAAMNVMLLSVSVWAGAEGASRQLFHWLSALIALPAVAYAGRPFFRSALGALRHGRTNMDVPISIGVLLACGMSLFETWTGGVHAYFDGALMLLAFLLGGRVLDAMMRGRALSGAEALIRRTAPGALVLRPDGASQWTAAEQLRPGDTVLVAAGEQFAADGVVLSGESRVDRALLTGETAAEPVGPGDAVLAGTLNRDAPIEVRLTATGEDRAIAGIARLMEAAGQSRSRYVRIADRAARLYAPAVHTLALLSFAGWMLMGAGWHQSLLIAIAVLIITCPCALGLAVPVAQVVATGALMRGGILVKDGSALERLAAADMVVFDKTGTLTLGRPVPAGIDALDAGQKGVALALARASRHPLSVGLRRALEAEGVAAARVSDIGETPGAGVHGLWQGEPVALRRPQAATSGQAVALCIGAAPPVLLCFSDALRPDTPAALAALKGMDLASAVASGDRPSAVAALAEPLGLTARPGLLPADKLAWLEALKAEGHRPLMVGDGLNDGPALAAAYASMAPSSASDVGQQAADLVFLGDSLLPVPRAVAAARRTMAVIRQNFALAIGYNVVAVPLAIMGQVTPLIAAAAMSGSSLVVVANAMRLRSCAR